MNRNKKISFVAVGDIGAFLQGDKSIVVAGHYNLHPLQLFADARGQFLCDTEVDILLLHIVIGGAYVFSAVTGIDHDYKIMFCSHFGFRLRTGESNRQ